jgi:hypothetical protein
MKISEKILLLLLLLTTGSCITQFIPETGDIKEFLVVEGLITDQNRSNTILLSKSSLLNSKFKKLPVVGYVVITDNLKNNYILREKKPGTYVTDSLNFRGVVGRKYILKISAGGYNYLSDTMEMKSVPPIDTIQSEKIINNTYQLGEPVPGYQVFVSTFDPTGKTGYYRWNFAETWEFRLPYNHSSIVNRVCWKSDYSRTVFIKTTKSLTEDRVIRFPLNFITAETDRLAFKYSLLLKQYSLNEAEYLYWDKIQKINQATGGLYDVVPISVKSNIRCIEDPAMDVLGYFSVSAVSEQRIFINPGLSGIPDLYKDCPNDTIPSWIPDPRIGKSIFVLMDYFYPLQTRPDPYYIITYNKACHDCSLSGSNVKPDYWDNIMNNSIPRDNYDFRK